MRHNKLKPHRVNDFVYVNSNLCLLSKICPQYMQGASIMWDIARDAHDSLDKTRVLEIA